MKKDPEKWGGPVFDHLKDVLLCIKCKEVGTLSKNGTVQLKGGCRNQSEVRDVQQIHAGDGSHRGNGRAPM